MSAIATVAITTVLVLAFRWYENNNLHQLTEDRNIAQAYAFANSVLPKYATHLAQNERNGGDAIRALPATRQLDVDLRQLTRNLPVLKVKIYSRSGLTIYSSDPSEIGESKAREPKFVRVIESGSAATTFRQRDLVSFGQHYKARSVAETFVAIRDDSGGLHSVMELFTDVSAYVAELDREIWTVMSMLVGGLGTLYVLLLLVVRHADLVLVRQYKELETFNARLEEKVDERTRRLLNQQSVLSWITKSDEFRSGNFDVAIGNLTRVTAATLDAERVSIWMFTPERDQLRCADLHCAGRGDHSKGQALSVERFPRYFAALLSQEHLTMDDAQHDERLSEFTESYLKPLGIVSILDVPIVHGGRIEGVLRIEQVGEPVKWTAEQRLFAIAIANFASLALERQERFKAEEDLREANRSVEAANRAKSLFLANMSHEIRTPMNGVFGMTDLLMRTHLNERQRKFVGIISNSAKRLLTIINDILDLSRIESGKLELDKDEFCFRASIEETIDLLAGEAQRKNLDLTVLIASDVPKTVSGDSGRLRQVLTNLVSNAIKFTNAGEVTVRIDCQRIEDGVASIAFEVRDTGIGIPVDVQMRLFQPFQQADTSISRRFGGTGLGLSISQHLVELMGGKVALSSEPGAGTCVSFVLPMPIAQGRQAAEPLEHEVARLAGRRVLVLDDRATNREVIQAYFNDCGAQTSGASSALDAYDQMLSLAAAGTRCGLVVVDMMMPEVNGLEFARMVRDHPELAGTPMIMLTSLSWKGDAKAARAFGFGAFLTKPVHRAELLKTACVVMSRHGGAGTDVTQDDLQIPFEKHHQGDRYQGRSVLVAEDNPVNFEVAREYLMAMGCEVVGVENGAQALEAIGDRQFDVVLMDCQMPEMDGLTATRRIRQLEAGMDGKHLVVIGVTANAFAEDRAQCLEAGMDDYMSKPFSAVQLGELLARWMPTSAADASTVTPIAKQVAHAAPNEAAIPAIELPPAPAASGPGAQAAASAVDLEMLVRMRRTHPKLLIRLLDTYLSYGPTAIQSLLTALVEEDVGQLKMAAHSLKSSSANVGAMRLSSMCRDLELRLKSATAWDAGDNLAAVAEIESEYQAVSAAMTEIREQSGSGSMPSSAAASA